MLSAMTVLSRAKETVASAGQHIADAMKVAIISCILSALALVVAIVALTRGPRSAAV
jgi:hypothetical protein